MSQRAFVRLALVVLLALVATAAHVTLAAPVITTNISHSVLYTRMISADEYKLVGFTGILLRGEMYLYNTKQSARAYKGTTIFVPCDVQLTRAALLELLAAPIRGLVYVACTDNIHNERTLSQLAATVENSVALYAMQEGPEATHLQEHLQEAPLAITAGVSLRTTEPFSNNTLPHAQLSSQVLYKPKEIRSSGRDEDTFRVLVTANADTMGLAPTSLTTGGASGAVAAVELYRRLLDTAADESLRPFVAALLLGTTARENYIGTTAWLAERTDEELNNYRMVVCLDELLASQDAGSESVLYMHVQDSFIKRVDGKKLVELAKATADEVGVELKVQSAKTNFQHYDLRFEHEVFANRQVAAATFSAHRSHQVEQLYRDSRPPLTEANVLLLAKRITFLHQFLLALVEVPQEKLASAAAKTWTGSASYMQGLLAYASQTPRSPLAKEGRSLVRFMSALELQLKQAGRSVRHVAHVTATAKLSTSTIQVAGIEFYGPYEQELKVFVSKPFIQEFLCSIVIVAAVLLFSFSELGLSGLKEAILPTEEVEQ